MAITAPHLQEWIGAEVLDGAGEKLGKLDDVYFCGDEPAAVSIRSGLGGRKHHAAVVSGATVTRDSLQLVAVANELVATDAHGLDAAQFSELGSHDVRLRDLQLADIETWTAREARLKAQAEARAQAEDLQAQARLHAEEEEAAAARARDADHDAETARLARKDAEARAEQVRHEAEPLV
ncbi:MAG TPA: PRC-barrel domain-containing protein [Solirubrobacteraceae bacterium]|jgi:hypothetical protein